MASGEKCCGEGRNSQSANSKQDERHSHGPHLSDWLKMRLHSLKLEQKVVELPTVHWKFQNIQVPQLKNFKFLAHFATIFS